MAILTHGSDLSLAPTVTPLVKAGRGTVRGAFAEAAEAGFQAVQLDATLRGIRPRELSRTGRRDLAAAASRAGLRVAGIDAFIPVKHLLDDAHVDRAVAAIVDAIDLAADLGKPPVSVAMPVEAVRGEPGHALVEAADGRGVPLALHAEGELDAMVAALDGADLLSSGRGVGLGVDPATVLLQRGDAGLVVQQHGKALVSARLSDADAALGQRTPVGEGDLDLAAYRVGVDLATGRAGPVVLDLRGLTEPHGAMARAAAAWGDASFALEPGPGRGGGRRR